MGLVSAAFLVILGLTGSVMAFENEWNRIVNPQLLKVLPQSHAVAWEDLRQGVEASEPAWRVQRMYMPAQPDDSTYVRLVSRTSARTDEIYVNQYSGAILGRKRDGNQLIWGIHEVHINLSGGNLGSRFVVGASIGLLGLSLSGIVLWWPRKIFRFTGKAPFARLNFDLHRALGFWSSLAMFAFAVTGLNLHIQTGGGLFDMMEQTSSPVSLAGHGITADELLQTAREAVPGALAMRISFWNDKRPVLVQMRFPEDHTPAGRTSVTLDPRTGAVKKVVSSRTAPLLYTALVQWNREIHTGTIFGGPSKALAALLSFLLALLALSGSTIWVNKQLAGARGRRIAAQRAREKAAC